MVKFKMNSRALLKYILGASEGDIMYTLFSEYKNKSTDEFVPKTYTEIALATGLEWETIRATVNRLVKKGLLQKKLGIRENHYVTFFKPEFNTDLYINFALQKLRSKQEVSNITNRNQAEDFIPEIIRILKSDPNVLVALDFIEGGK